MSTKVKFGLTYNPNTWTEGKIYFNNGGEAISNPLAEKIYLNGKDYSGVKEVKGESESSGYIVGSLEVDDKYVKIHGWDTKTDKITGPVNGNLVAMDAGGNLVNSGKKPSSFDEAGAAAAVVGSLEDTIADNTVLGVKNALQDIQALVLKKSDLVFSSAQSEPIIGDIYGVAGLDSTGKVPSSQLPSYVDDVVEVRGGFYYDGDIYCPAIVPAVGPGPISGEDSDFNKNATTSDFNANNKVKISDLDDPATSPHGTYYVDFTTKTIYKCVRISSIISSGKWVEAFTSDELKGKMFVVTNMNNKTYRYAGTTSGFIEIVASPGTTDEITEGTINKFVTVSDKANWNAKVDGPSSSTNSHVAVFDGTTGKLIKDSGFTIAQSVPSGDLLGTTEQYHYSPEYNDTSKTATIPDSSNVITPSVKESGTIYGIKTIYADPKGHILGYDVKPIGTDDVANAQSTDNMVTYSSGWSNTPQDYKYPSEKIVKAALDALTTSVNSSLIWD